MMDVPLDANQGIVTVAVTGPLGGPEVDDTCAAGEGDRAGLVALPKELLAQALMNLDHKDLLQCCVVCKHLRAVILGDVRLQYTIELAADGMVDGVSCDMPVGERLRALRDQRARWRFATWTTHSAVHLPQFLRWYFAYADGVLVVGPTGTRPDHRKQGVMSSMPSRYGEEHRAVPLSLPGTTLTAVALDTTQDLIVLVGVADARQDDGHKMAFTFTVHPRSISTSATETHPKCQLSEFGRSIGFDEKLGECSVCGHSFGIFISPDFDGTAGFHIWDWRSGERLVWICLSHMSSDLPFYNDSHFSFLLPDLILMSSEPTGNYRERCLPVFAIGDAHGGTPRNVAYGTIKHLVSLALPKMHRSAEVNISTGPNCLGPAWGKPFGMTVSSHIYRIDIRFGLILAIDGNPIPLPLDPIYSACLFVHHDTIMKLASEYAHMADGSTELPAVPWEKWGPDNTRIVTHRNRQSYHDFVSLSIHGERGIVNLADRDTPDDVLHILDFNVHRPRTTSVDHDPSIAAQLISEPSTINLPECFLGPVTTRLPYYSTPLTTIPNDHIVLMDQDRIMAMQASPQENHNPDDMTEVGVWVFS